MPQHWPPPEEREAERRRIEAWRPWAILIAIVLGILVLLLTFVRIMDVLG